MELNRNLRYKDIKVRRYYDTKKIYPPSQRTESVLRQAQDGERSRTMSSRIAAKHFTLRRDYAPDEAWGEDTPTVRSRELHVSGDKFLSIAYHDIFEYPLEARELGKWTSGVSENVKFLIEKTGKFYHLVGRANIVLLRRAREKYSNGKLKLARAAARVLSKIPTVKFVGITGSLAMNNAEKDSDIDLMVVTHVDSLWITRIFVYGILKLYGLKIRRPGRVGDISDSLCLNLWLDENNLSVPEGMRNLYTAHEILQVIPVVNKNNTFEKFLTENRWAEAYWPKAAISNKRQVMGKSTKISFLKLVTCYMLLLTEFLAYRLQLWHMRKKMTRELIEPGRAFFHPINWSGFVISEFRKRVKRLRCLDSRARLIA